MDSMRLRLPKILLVLSLTAVFEMIGLFIYASSYPTMSISLYIIPLNIVIILNLIIWQQAERLRRRTIKYNVIGVFFIILILPVIFLSIKPTYSYEQAKHILARTESVNIIDFNVKTNYSDSHYYYQVKNSDGKGTFLIHPNSGEIIKKD
ncbi:hypothetical protein LC040_11010 [Bacillus tianshenii]|nr:hypothetical protein LC040_11010 [Bacillus tianshenii]